MHCNVRKKHFALIKAGLSLYILILREPVLSYYRMLVQNGTLAVREWEDPHQVTCVVASRAALLFGPLTALSMFFLHSLQLLPRSVSNDFGGQFSRSLIF
jgi:hypothetical protein